MLSINVILHSPFQNIRIRLSEADKTTVFQEYYLIKVTTFRNMSSSTESVESLQSVPSIDEHIAVPDTNEQSNETGTNRVEFSNTANVFIVSSPSDSETTTISTSTLRDDQDTSATTTADTRSTSEQHPRQWSNDEVFRWFHSNKLDDLYNSLFYSDDAKDGAALDKIFQLKLQNYERYRAQYRTRLQPDNKNLLKDFDQFGQLLDNYFIDKYAYRFDVAFSFPGDIRDQVSRIAEKLCKKINTRQGEQRLFYDKYHKAELARPDLDLYLQSIYRYQARLIVVFMCDPYKCKEWCGLEGRAIRGLMKAHQSDRIMLLTVDGKTIEGISDIDGYWNIQKETDDAVVEGIYQRLDVLGELLPSSGTLRPSPPLEDMMSKMIVASKNIFRSISPWYIVVTLLSYILGTLTSR